jgi:GTP-binding protein Era
MEKHQAGFVSIIGKPNAGKSTLMNALVGERLAIITAKAQTTRHRIMGIINTEAYQIVYSDTPGIINPQYELQKAMMKFVSTALEDADVVLWVVDIRDTYENDQAILERIARIEVPVVLVLNKVDISDQAAVLERARFWQEKGLAKDILAVSALHQFNTDAVLPLLLAYIPEHPPFFPKDELTDKTQRFFAAEIIREKIFLFYEQEIPYCTEVVIEQFKDAPDLIRISSVIMVERDSQKGIIIGKGGSMLKKVGAAARKDMEAFFEKKVFLEQHVKVELDWRKKEQKLRRFGYVD